MKYAECIVASNLRGLDSLTYLIPPDLQKKINLGSIVLVPLRSRTVPAIVSALSESTNLQNLKSIKDIADTIPAPTFGLLRFLSEHYLAPLPLVVKTVLPDIPIFKRSQGVSDLSQQGPGFTAQINFDMDYKIIAETAITKSASGQVLILCPTAREARKVTKLLPSASTRLLDLSLTKSGFFKLWQEFKSGEFKILVGSRRAVFIPARLLRAVIVLSDESTFYKEEKRPKFNSADLAFKLAELRQSELIIFSLAPRLETIQKFHPTLTPPDKVWLEKIQIAALKPNQIFTTELISTIGTALKNKQKVLLYHNRLGTARFLVCSDCRFIFNCPDCSVPQAIHKSSDGHILVCHHCNLRVPAPPTCPKCSSKVITMYGYGIEKIEELIKQQFPNTTVSILKGGGIVRQAGGAAGGTDITIATNAIFNTDLKFDLIGAISADSSFYLPDFRANERTFATFQYMKKHLREKGHIIAQSTLGRDEFFTAAISADYAGFYKGELSERETFKLPPYTSLIDIRYEDKDAKKVFEQLTAIKSALLRHGLNVKGPTPGYVPRVRNKVIGHLLVTINKPLSPEARDVLISLQRPFSLDRDPTALI